MFGTTLAKRALKTSPEGYMARIQVDGNAAAASVAHRSSEVIAIYPITPASPMGEHADAWSAAGRKNLWGEVPAIVEMQSEAGAAGALHGALQAGALATTFTASQGLLLMIPDMYKIAGELTPFCMHVAARTVATHALSIFCDHSDVMACRGTGFGMLASTCVQEAQDLAAIAHAAALSARIPFLHFFDGFRTSHEIATIEALDDATLLALYDGDAIAAHRSRALSPDHPVVRGTAQNPDTFFQAREAINSYYDACPAHVARAMEKFAELTGRRYRLFDYEGHPEPERVVVAIGSACETLAETAARLNDAGERVGVINVRLYRPFDVDAFAAALPASVRAIAVLDRTKEPGSIGEPLYLDVMTALARTGRSAVKVVGGRYGLSSKEFSPAMARAVYEALAPERLATTPNPFTVGIVDDVTHRSLPFDRAFGIEAPGETRAILFGVGADGTVSASKAALAAVGKETGARVQGYFVYDSRKSGSVTVAHLRFGARPIRAPYLIERASYVGIHHARLLERLDILDAAEPGAVVVLNSPLEAAGVWAALPYEAQQQVLEKKLRLFAIDAFSVAESCGLGHHVGTALLACFLALSGVAPAERALACLRDRMKARYGEQGPEIVAKNVRVLDLAVAALRAVVPPAGASATGKPRPAPVPAEAPPFVQRVTAAMLEGRGDALPVSAFPVDGTWPVGTARWERRGMALALPFWEERLCIECNKCALVCPHAAIRMKVADDATTRESGLPSIAYKGDELGSGKRYVLAVAPDDCTGCGVCVEACPAHEKSDPSHRALVMREDRDPSEHERLQQRWRAFLALPSVERHRVHLDVKGSQLLEPLFEFSGACAACGEAPYIKLLTQLLGDRLLIANATGCSSIFGGNLPTTPYCANADGRGPAWSNSLFEDNAEFGLGMRVALDQRAALAASLLCSVAGAVADDELVRALLAGATARPGDERAIASQRERVAALRTRLAQMEGEGARRLEQLADDLVPKAVWIVGGDGWAYDIGYGGLDHVLASGADVKVLVLDSEVYSNTGGQQSKATPLGAVAKFASGGKRTGKKDLGLLAMTYGNVYVARIAMGAKDLQALRALEEAQAYPGPALVIAYAHCIAHGYPLEEGLAHQKLSVEAGLWPLYRFDPRRIGAGEPPLKLDTPPLKARAGALMSREDRFQRLAREDRARYDELVAAAEREADTRHTLYDALSKLSFAPAANGKPSPG